MAAPRHPPALLDLVADLCRQAEAAGAVPLGLPICTGRISTRKWIECHTGWTTYETRGRIRAAIRDGRVAVQTLDALSDDDDAPSRAAYPAIERLHIEDGTVLCGSDLHAWPGKPHPIWWAFVIMADRLRPAAIVMNGDIVDGARISRHGHRREWTPTITEEIDAARALLDMLPDDQPRFRTIGNHDDMRLDTYMANNAAELNDFAGTLTDRLPGWSPCLSLLVSDTCVFRHRFRNGIHAAWNDGLHSGKTMVTGHDHTLGCTAVRNLNGSHWGVKDGMLADPAGPQFAYTEYMPNRWQPGFVVLTFRGGVLQPPELCEWQHGEALFRGERVRPRIRVKAIHDRPT